MPDNDAFWLTSSITKYLNEGGGPGLAKNTTPDASGTWYAEHNGARMFREKGEHWYVIGSRNSIHWLLSALFLTPLAAYAPGWLGQLVKPRRKHDVQPIDASVAVEAGQQPLPGAVDVLTPRDALGHSKQLCDDLAQLPSHFTASQLAEVYSRFTKLGRATQSVSATTQSDRDAIEETQNVLKEVEETFNQMGVSRIGTQDQSPKTNTPLEKETT